MTIKVFCEKCCDFEEFDITANIYLMDKNFARRFTCRRCGYWWFEIDDMRDEPDEDLMEEDIALIVGSKAI